MVVVVFVVIVGMSVVVVVVVSARGDCAVVVAFLVEDSGRRQRREWCEWCKMSGRHNVARVAMRIHNSTKWCQRRCRVGMRRAFTPPPHCNERGSKIKAQHGGIYSRCNIRDSVVPAVVVAVAVVPTKGPNAGKVVS